MHHLGATAILSYMLSLLRSVLSANRAEDRFACPARIINTIDDDLRQSCIMSPQNSAPTKRLAVVDLLAEVFPHQSQTLDVL